MLLQFQFKRNGRRLLSGSADAPRTLPDSGGNLFGVGSIKLGRPIERKLFEVLIVQEMCAGRRTSFRLAETIEFSTPDEVMCNHIVVQIEHLFICS